MAHRSRIARRLALSALLLAPLGAPMAATAAPDLLLKGDRVVRDTPVGSSMPALDAPPPARVTATAARATAASRIDTRRIRRAINAAGGAPNRRVDAQSALSRLLRARGDVPRKSQARREIDAVLRTFTTMARRSKLTSARLPMLTETARRNAQWWRLRKATGSGQRVRFNGSQLLWQYYPGQGMQLQWLGSFGRGNALYYTGNSARTELSSFVLEAERLQVDRSGGTAWEYFFPFGGGSPPWVSGMAEATGIQVFSRAATVLNRPQLLTAARQAQGILKTPPPGGVQVLEASGTHFLIYSFDPDLKVLNAMTQTVNGLYAYVLANPSDVDGRLLLLDGLRWLDSNVDRYMLSNWSLYALGGSRATAHYQVVARDFLRTLCKLLNTDAATAGGGPSGAFPSTRICRASDTLTGFITA